MLFSRARSPEFLAHTWTQIQAAATLLVGQLLLTGQAQFYNDATRLYTSSKTHNALYYPWWLKRAAAVNWLVYLHHRGSPKSAAAQLYEIMKWFFYQITSQNAQLRAPISSYKQPGPDCESGALMWALGRWFGKKKSFHLPYCPSHWQPPPSTITWKRQWCRSLSQSLTCS